LTFSSLVVSRGYSNPDLSLSRFLFLSPSNVSFGESKDVAFFDP